MSKRDNDPFCDACGKPMGEWRQRVERYNPKTGLPVMGEPGRLCSNPNCYRHRPDPGRRS